MQRDEITQEDHQLQCCRHANDFRQGYNTYWLECALSQLGLNHAIGCMKGGISTFARIDYVNANVAEYFRRKVRRQ
jgi:predicted HD phosphohydrolase